MFKNELKQNSKHERIETSFESRNQVFEKQDVQNVFYKDLSQK